MPNFGPLAWEIWQKVNFSISSASSSSVPVWRTVYYKNGEALAFQFPCSKRPLSKHMRVALFCRFNLIYVSLIQFMDDFNLKCVSLI